MAVLRLLGNPQAAERLCDDEDDSDAVSGFFSARPCERSGVTSCLSLSQASGDFGSGDGDLRQTGHAVQVCVISTSSHFSPQK